MDHRFRLPPGDNCHPELYTVPMRTITIRDLRTRPRQARQVLDQGEKALLTANGKPVALMVPVSAETLDATIAALRRAEAELALAAIRRLAHGSGSDRLSLRQIDDLVASTRKARVAERRATGRA
jgi:antitoxin (DNA-binding transcriptional repressor) of toxin-antitoxin stability system